MQKRNTNDTKNISEPLGSNLITQGKNRGLQEKTEEREVEKKGKKEGEDEVILRLPNC